MNSIEYDKMPFPSLATRVKAVLFDIGILMAVFVLTTFFIDTVSDIPGYIKGFIFIFMLYFYDPLLISLTGGTPGHKAMKLTVRDYKHPEKKISILNAFIRFTVKGILGWLSFLTVTASKHKRAIHDFASGSIILHDK